MSSTPVIWPTNATRRRCGGCGHTRFAAVIADVLSDFFEPRSPAITLGVSASGSTTAITDNANRKRLISIAPYAKLRGRFLARYEELGGRRTRVRVVTG